MKLLTLKQISRLIESPENTVRYHRDQFESFIPVVGEGRTRRYPSESVEAFKIIGAGFKAGNPREMIEDELKEQFGVQITPPQTSTTPPQDILFEFAVVFESLKQSIMQENQGLRDEIQSLRSLVEERMEERDRNLTQLIRQMQEGNLPWWKRIFKKKEGE